ncbi:MAG: hypothetical protein HYY04_03020 [Chloroflexi bacterium]|nr:hypothetical protein [Chloroflexota bacterium]
MSRQPPPKNQPEKRVEEKVGRFLGKLVKKATKTRVWQESAEAFEAGKRGEYPPKK